jgi:RHS repeat-associated protein
MRLRVLLAAAVVVLAQASRAQAQPAQSLVTSYDRTFTKEKGDSDKPFRDAFQVPTTDGTWYVTVETSTRSASAKISLNGERVFNEGAFHRDDEGSRVFRRAVKVQAKNELVVQDLDGTPGSQVHVHVDGVVPTADLPAATGQSVVEKVVFEQAFQHGTTQAAFALATTSGLYWLDVTDGPVAPRNATVKLNGQLLADGDDLPRGRREIPVLVLANDTVTVDVKEPSDGSLVVSVRGFVPQQQQGQDTISIAFTQPQGGVYTNLSGNVVVTYSDTANMLDTSTFQVTVNGTDATARFTVGAGSATAALSALSLAEGANALVATIKNTAGAQAQASLNVLVDSKAPTVTLAPSSGFTNATPTFTASYSDAGSGINLGSFSATLDGSNVTGSFTTSAAAASGKLGPLAAGNHVLTVTIADNVGNVSQAQAAFTVDAAAPSLAIAPVVTFTSASQVFTVSYSDAQSGVNTASFQATLDGTNVTGSFTAGAASATGTLAGLGNGAHALTVTVSDKVGNQATATLNFTADSAAPQISVSPSTGFTNGTPAFSVTYSDAGSGINPASFAATLDGANATASFIANAAGANGTLSLGTGAHTLVVSVADHVGNVAQAQSVFTVDVTPPSVTVSATLGAKPTVTVSYSDAGSGVNTGSFKATLDGADATAKFTTSAAGATGSVGPLAVGPHAIIITVSDNVGNQGSANAQLVVVAPTISVAPNSSFNGYTSASPAFTVSYADAGGPGLDLTSFKASVDGQGVSSFTAGNNTALGSVGPLQDGAHVLSVSISDTSGVMATATTNFTSDGTAPALTIALAPLQGAYTSPSPAITVSYTDAGSGNNAASLRLLVDGTDETTRFAVGGNSAVGTPLRLTDGSHTLTAVIQDQVGNVGQASQSFTADALPPVLTVLTTGGANPGIAALYSDPQPGSGLNMASFQAVLDGQPVTGSFTVAGGQASAKLGPLGPGAHTLAITIGDLVGNASTVTLDPTQVNAAAPTVTISPQVAATTGTATFTVNYTDASAPINLGSFAATLDGTPVTSSFTVGASSATATFTNLPDGPHKLTASIADPAGDTGTASESFTSVSVPPTVTVVSTVSTSPAVTVTFASEFNIGVNPATFHATLDGSDVTAAFTFNGANTATATLGPLAGTTHTLVVTIADVVGNVGGTTATIATSDIVPPVISSPTFSPFANGFTSSLPLIQVAYADNGSGASGINSSSLVARLDGADVTKKAGFSATTTGLTYTVGTALADGAHSLFVQINDNAGNVASQTFNFGVDSAAPTLAVSPSGGTLATQSPTFTLSYTDAESGINVATARALVDGASAAKLSASGSQAQFQPIAPLSEGSHRLDAFVSDQLGNAVQTTVVFTVSLQAVSFSLTLSPGDPNQLAVGSTNDLTIKALDANGSVAPVFSGLVQISVSDHSPPLDGTIVNFTSDDNGIAFVSSLAVFNNLGHLTVTATALANPALTGSLAVSVLPSVRIEPEPLVAYIGGAGTVYNVSIIPNTANATLTIGGNFATFNGAVSINVQDGGAFTLTGKAVGSDTLQATVTSLPAMINNALALTLPVVVSPQLSGTFLFTATPEPEQNPAGGGAGVYLSNGQVHLERVDLAVPSRGEIHYAFARTYKSYVQNTLGQGTLGYGWVHNYDMRLKRVDANTVLWFTGTGRAEAFIVQADGTYRSPTGFFCRLLGTDAAFTIREPNGMLYAFKSLSDPVAPGALASITDRHGNQLTMTYGTSGNSVGLLTQVQDPYLRKYTYAYDANHHLVSVTDFGNRAVTFTYSAAGDLVKVTSPVVVNNTKGVALIPQSQFPNGKSEIYAYTGGSNDARLNHKLTLVVAPNEAVNVPAASLTDQNFLGPLARVTNTWTVDPLSPSYLRLASQTVGGTNATGSRAGGTFAFNYTPVSPAGGDPINDEVLQVSTLDRAGNLSDTFVNAPGQTVRVRQYTNRNVRPRGAAPGQDPSFFESQLRYNVDGLRTMVQRPLGNEVLLAYDSQNVDRSSQANLLTRTLLPDGRGDSRGGTTPRVATMTYEPIYNMLRTFTEERGNDPSWTPNVSAQTYTWTNFFDYQQTASISSLATAVSLDQATTQALLTAANVQLGLGDLNSDSSDDAFMAGDVVKTVAPQTTLVNGTQQQAVTLTVRNNHGQPTSVLDAERNYSTFTYHFSEAPDGFDAVPGNSNFDNGGYLFQTVVDSRADAQRDSGTNPFPTRLTTTYSTDMFGNVIGITDRRGIQHTFDVNPLNQVVHVTLATVTNQAVLTRDQQLAALSYERHVIFDANNNVVETRVGNQGERDGTGAFVAANPWWDTKWKLDILDHVVESIEEVTPIQNDDSITDTSPGVIVTRFAYDANENLALVTKPMGNQVATVYDERDLVFLVTRGYNSPAASTTSRYYDLNGNLEYFVSAVKNNPSKNTFFPQGDVTTTIYDGFDRRVGVVDPELDRTQSVLDPASHVARVVRYGPPEEGAPRLAESAMLYDEQGRLATTRNYVFNYGAASTGAPFLTTNPVLEATPAVSGESWAVNTVLYDALGRTKTTTFADGEQYDYAYDGASRTTDVKGPVVSPSTVSPPHRNEVTATYDGEGHTIKTVQTDTSSTGFGTQAFTVDTVYDAVGRVIRVSDAINITTRHYYDSRGNEIATSDGRSSASLPDPLSLRGAGSSINGDGNVTLKYYDGRSRLIEVDHLMKVGGVGDGSPNLTAFTNLDTSNPAIPTGVVKNFTQYDANSRVVARIDGNNNSTVSQFNTRDELTGQIFADLTAQLVQRDLDGNPVQTTDPNGSVVTTAFDANGRWVTRSVSRAQNLAGTNQNVIGTTFQASEWDGLGRQRVTIDDNGNAAALGVASSMTYDSVGHKLAEREQMNANVSANNVATTNGRVNVQDVGGTVDMTVTYDYNLAPGGAGQPFARVPTTLGYPTSPAQQQSLHFVLDGAQRQGQVYDFNKPVSQGAQGNEIIATTFLGARENAVTIASPTAMLFESVGFSADGCPHTCVISGTGIVPTGGGTTVPMLAFTYTHDNAYNFTQTQESVLDPNPIQNFGYNSSNQLTSTSYAQTTSGPATSQITQVVDSALNDIETVENNTTTTFNTTGGSYAEDVLNRILQEQTFVGGTLTATSHPIYDAAGARIQDSKRHLEYDAFGRMAHVDRSFDGGATFQAVADYTYFADGRRATKRATVNDPSSGQFVRSDNLAFVCDGAREIEEVDLGSGQVVANYIWGASDIDELRVFQNQNGRFSVTGDRQMSTYLVCDFNTALPVERYSYTNAYGRCQVMDPGVLSTNGGANTLGSPRALAGEIKCPFRFQGRRFDDESGLYYFRARYMDPEEGRFVTRDPLGVWGDPSGRGNAYAFEGGNPTSRRDPFGLDGEGVRAVVRTTGRALDTGTISRQLLATRPLAMVPGRPTYLTRIFHQDGIRSRQG